MSAAAGSRSELVLVRTALMSSYPVAPGHADVGNQHVRLEATQGGQGGFDRRRGGDLGATVAQHTTQQVERVGLVVDDQYTQPAQVGLGGHIRAPLAVRP